MSSMPLPTDCGCTQGAKISTLTAAVDDRVRALCLWDPVDVTVYAPQSAEYPSAVAALRNVQSSLPVAIVGGGRAGDCAPKSSNYRYPDCCFACSPSSSHHLNGNMSCLSASSAKTHIGICG